MTDTSVEREPSNEADERQLELARMADDACMEAVEYMVEGVAHTGVTKGADDYAVGFVQEEAEGMYRLAGEGELAREGPDEESGHLEVAVADAADHRFVPHLDVRATLVPANGGEAVGPFEVPFLRHPGLFYYGRNVEVPGDGEYTLRIEVDPPTFVRHDEDNGNRYAEAAEVESEGVDVETGQDLPGDRSVAVAFGREPDREAAELPPVTARQ